MKCDRCKAAEATIHLAQSLDGKVRKIHLCESCADASGISIKQTLSVTDVLLGLDQLGQDKEADQSDETAEVICPECGISREEYKKRGRLGCAGCYEAFSADLRRIIRAVHHSEQHDGKRPPETDAAPRDAEMKRLNAELRDAVKREDYEEAARVRDRMERHNQENAGDGRR